MYNMSNRHELPTLSDFVSFLEDHNLIDFSVIQDEEGGFVNRLRMQKYVYLAKYYGLDLGYSYTMYRYGPYSPDLTAAYYSLSDDANPHTVHEMPVSFRTGEFVNLIYGKDENWLEIATTLLEQNKRIQDKELLVQRVETIKCSYPIEYIRKVLSDLVRENLI